MSFQEAVFQNNVLVRQIINHLINGPVSLLNIALINKKFNEEICSRLRQIHSLDFYSIKVDEEQPSPISSSSSSLDMDNSEDPAAAKTAIADEVKDEILKPASIQLGLNEILCNDSTIFNSNLSFITHQSPIISLNFQQFLDGDNDADLKMDSLLRLKDIQSLKFHPSQRCSSNAIYCKLIDKNLSTLKELIHPPENFFKSLLPDDSCLKLDNLEIDIGVFRSMYRGIQDLEDVFYFEVEEKFEDIIGKKFKFKSLTLHGHNRARFMPLYYSLLSDSNVTSIKMICDEPNTISEDLMIFQEWKNRNQCFPQVIDFELIFWNDILQSHYDTAIALFFDVFPKLSKVKLGSQQYYSADECFEIIDSIQKYWKKNYVCGKCEHSIHLNSTITKEQMNNFELRLMTHKCYRKLSKSCKIWLYTMRISNEDILQINFHFS